MTKVQRFPRTAWETRAQRTKWPKVDKPAIQSLPHAQLCIGAGRSSSVDDDVDDDDADDDAYDADGNIDEPPLSEAELCHCRQWMPLNQLLNYHPGDDDYDDDDK